MSSHAAHPEVPTPSYRAMRRVQRKSWLAQICLKVLGSNAARIGLVWVGLLILMAVFAPFIANSHPIYWSINGKGESPLLQHLTPADVILLVMFFAVIVLAFLKMLPMKVRLMIGLGVLVVSSGVSLLTISPSEAVVFKKYRDAVASGEAQSVIRTPIAFSPADYQRDKLGVPGEDPRLLPPSLAHPMGTTKEGADVASRMIHACRIALAIGLLATGIAVCIGVTVGGFMGYFSGLIDLMGMRVVEVFSAIPVIFLLIMICAFYERNIYLMMVIIGLTSWVGYALFVRAEFLKLRKMDYVQAARAIGVPLPLIIFKHLLPNGVTPVLVLASFGIASAILLESTLSFLGLGLLPQDPSWGQLLNEARYIGPSAWWLMMYPGLAIFLTVLSYNLIGEALRDALDPRARK